MSVSPRVIAGASFLALLLSAGAAAASPGEATASVNVRSGPGTSYRIVDTLYPGENVDIRRCAGGFCYVVHSGPDGWVSSRYLGGGNYDPAPIYDEPNYDEPLYDSPPIYVTPPFFPGYPVHSPRPHRDHHVWPGNGNNPPPQNGNHTWPGNGTHHGNWQPGTHTGTTPHPQGTPPMHTHTGQQGNFCQLNPDACQHHPRSH